jgi:luciferase family oxidoreductase group 1
VTASPSATSSGTASLSTTPLSVLDLAPIVSGKDARTAVGNTIELAKHAEKLGYHRFWVAEHHNMPGIASSATAVLIGQIAAATTQIRVGSGGVMLPNHSPLIVAEQFGTLGAFYPGRIDLGIGRAPGSDQRTAVAIRGSASALSPNDFPQQLVELMDYFEPDPDRPVNAYPAVGYKPEFWLLGSSGFSAQLAGTLGLPFAFAHHFSPDNTLPALALYREHFRPSSILDKPHVTLAVSVTCADTDDHAREIAAPSGLVFLSLRKGKPIVLPTPQAAADYPYSEIDRMLIEERMSSQIIGSPETVRVGLENLLAQTDADELMITTMIYDDDDRLRSYELVSSLSH